MGIVTPPSWVIGRLCEVTWGIDIKLQCSDNLGLEWAEDVMTIMVVTITAGGGDPWCYL